MRERFVMLIILGLAWLPPSIAVGYTLASTDHLDHILASITSAVIFALGIIVFDVAIDQ